MLILALFDYASDAFVYSLLNEWIPIFFGGFYVRIWCARVDDVPHFTP